MGQHAYNNTFDMSVQANYQALMGFIDAALIADGWTLTADTGQTDPSSAALPAANAQTVYRVYQSPAVTGLTRLYLKLSFERTAGNSPQITGQFGTGASGSGGLTGTTTTARTVSPLTTANPSHAYVSAAAGYVVIVFDPAQTNGNGCFFVMDRSIDATETLTDRFYTQFSYVNGGTRAIESKMLDGTTQPAIQSSIMGPVPNSASWIVGDSVIVPFFHPFVHGGYAQPSPNVALRSNQNADFAIDTVTTINIYGVDHHYIVGGQPTGNGNTFPMYRYD